LKNIGIFHGVMKKCRVHVVCGELCGGMKEGIFAWYNLILETWLRHENE
jgi:hypothetical protein